MVHHTVHVPISYNGSVSVFVFGDLQWGCDGFKAEAWQEFKRMFLASKGAVALGLGDYEDWLRPTMRGRVISAISHDDSARSQLDDRTRKLQDKLLDEMAFLEGRCIGIHEGHHDWDFMDGTKSSQRIASALRAPFLGWMASTRLAFDTPRDNNKTHRGERTYTMISMHGQSNSRRTGGHVAWSENSLANGGWVADHYILGHACRSIAWIPNERRTIRRNGPAGIDVSLPRCLNVGGFHDGFTDGWNSSYVERSGFSPQPIGWGEIRFTRGVAGVNGAKERGITNRKTKVIRIEQLNHNPSS